MAGDPPLSRSAAVMASLRDVVRLQLLLTATAAAACALWATIHARGVSFTAALAASIALTTALPLTSRWPTLATLARVPVAAGAAAVFVVALAAAAVVAAAAWAVALGSAVATDVAAAMHAGAVVAPAGAGAAAGATPAPWVKDIDDYRSAVDAAGRALWATGGAHPAELALLLCGLEDTLTCRGWRTGDCHGRREAAAEGARRPPRDARPCPTNCTGRLGAAGWTPRVVVGTPTVPPVAPPHGALPPAAVDAVGRGAVDGRGAAAASSASTDGCLDVALTWVPAVSGMGGLLDSMWGVLAAVAVVAASSGILSLVLCVRVN